jgi:hypothetical protein
MQRETDDLDDGDRALLERLRSSERAGNEPDWAALELAIRNAVSDIDPRPWWRRWRWVVPVGVLAATAAAAVLLLRAPHEHESVPPQASSLASSAPLSRAVPAVVTSAAEAPAALWLDDAAVDLDDIDDATFDELDRDARNALSGDGQNFMEGILPTHDLHWIDDLDETSIQRVEHWLEGKKT